GNLAPGLPSVGTTTAWGTCLDDKFSLADIFPGALGPSRVSSAMPQVTGSNPGPNFYGIFVVDGCTGASNPHYTCDYMGLRQAINDAHQLQSTGIVFIPPTGNCVNTCSIQGVAGYLNLASQTITVPSNTVIMGAGKRSVY